MTAVDASPAQYAMATVLHGGLVPSLRVVVLTSGTYDAFHDPVRLPAASGARPVAGRGSGRAPGAVVPAVQGTAARKGG